MICVIAVSPAGGVGQARRARRTLVVASMLRPICDTDRMDDSLLARLRAARDGLATTRPAIEAGAPWPMAAVYDDSDEARWGPGEVLAHLAEMAPYWLGEIERVLDGPEEP